MKDLLEELEEASNDEDREWILLEFNLDRLDAKVRSAVRAAAVPRWFNAAFLAALLDEPDVKPLFEQVVALSIVEPFPGRGYNVHERTRALLLTRLWRRRRSDMIRWSRRAAEFCLRQDQDDIGWFVEALHHRLLARDSKAISDFAEIGIGWINSFEINKLEVLTRTIIDQPVPHGRPALAWAHAFQGHIERSYSRHSVALRHLHSSMELSRGMRRLRSLCALEFGKVYYALDRYDEALTWLSRSLKYYRSERDEVGEADCLDLMGNINFQLDNYAQAERLQNAALAKFRALHNNRGIANALVTISRTERFFGRTESSLGMLQEALDIFKASRDLRGEINALVMFGETWGSLGDTDRAFGQYSEAVELARHAGHAHAECMAVIGLGRIALLRGETEAARERFDFALKLARQMASEWGEATSLEGLGTVLLTEGEHTGACEKLEEASRIFAHIGDRYNEARTLGLIAETYEHRSLFNRAAEYYKQAEGLFTQILDKEDAALMAAAKDALPIGHPE